VVTSAPRRGSAYLEGDFEKGEADGSVEALAVIYTAAQAWSGGDV
jgi:hypothetical protein